MPNPWIEHIKTFAEKNDMTYGQALKSPECKASYKKVKGGGKASGYIQRILAEKKPPFEISKVKNPSENLKKRFQSSPNSNNASPPIEWKSVEMFRRCLRIYILKHEQKLPSNLMRLTMAKLHEYCKTNNVSYDSLATINNYLVRNEMQSSVLGVSKKANEERRNKWKSHLIEGRRKTNILSQKGVVVPPKYFQFSPKDIGFL